MVKIKSSNNKTEFNFIDKAIFLIVRAQLALISISLIWVILTWNSLDVVLAYFVLMLEVPLVLLVCLLSLVNYKKLQGMSRLMVVALVINWLTLAFLIYNVTD